jgi:hypothetical protein
MDGDLVSKLQDAGFKEGDYVLYSPDDFSPKAVQGAEADYVIINDMPDATEDNYQNLINLYTYLSRSLVGSLVNIGTYADSLRLINNQVPYTSDYSVPGLDTLEEEKQKKIAALEDILGDYKPEASTSAERKETKASEDTESDEDESSIQMGNTSKVKDPKDLKQVEDIIDEGESKIRKKSSPRPEYHKANPEDTKATHMYGYGFYTRTGVKKVGGRFKPVNFGTHLDLDGLLQGKTYIKD